MKSVVTPILRRFGFRTVLTTNGILNAILMAGCALLFPQTAKSIMLFILFVNGLSRSMQFTAVGTLAFADIAKPDMSSATSFFSMITQMSMGMGVAVGAIALRLAGFPGRKFRGRSDDEGVSHGVPARRCFERPGDARLFPPRSGRRRGGQRASVERRAGENIRRHLIAC